MIVGGPPLTDNGEFVSVVHADGLEVDGCRTEGADKLGERLRLGEDTFEVTAGLEGPEVLAGENGSAETPFAAGFGGELSFLE